MWSINEDTKFCESGDTWLEILETPVRGLPYVRVAHQYIAAKLNVENGADKMVIQECLNDVKSMLEDSCPNGDLSDIERANECQELFDDFNNGRVGPGHCDDNNDSKKRTTQTYNKCRNDNDDKKRTYDDDDEKCGYEENNPYPYCTESYNFIGTVNICVPEDKVVDVDWETYFYIDTGIVIEQLWGDGVGDWSQEDVVVTVNGQATNQLGLSDTCTTVYFRARKPNPNLLYTEDEVVKPNGEVDDTHCGFFVEYENESNILINVEFDTTSKRSIYNTIDNCITFNTEGCYNPDLNNVQPSGYECGGTNSRVTPDSCPICNDNQVDSLLLDDGLTINSYITNLEEELGVPSGTFTVVSVTDENNIIRTSLKINGDYDTSILDENNIPYEEVICMGPKENSEVQNSSSTITSVNINYFVIIAILYFI
jgi:hypothetical protein